MGQRPTDAREPGTGTQYHPFATPPDADDDRQNGMRINGRYWKVGHDYLDTEIGDVCTLVGIRGESTWCDTRPPEECSPELVFAYERYGHQRSAASGTITVDPNHPDGPPNDRFIERHDAPLPRGAEYPW